MNNNFSFKRLCNLLRLQFTFDWRRMLIGAVGLFGVASIIYFLTNINNIFNSTTDISGGVVAESSMIMLARFILIPIAGFVYIYLISESFKPYFQHGVGAASMMLPATRLEKFTVTLIKFVTAPLAITLVLMITDFIWVTLIIKQADQNIFVEAARLIAKLWQKDAIIAGITMISCEAILYYLCSALFRRHTLIMSIIAVSGFHFVVMILGSILFFSYFDNMENVYFGNFDGESTTLRYIFSIAQLLFVTALVYLTWLRFTRIQIGK